MSQRPGIPIPRGALGTRAARVLAHDPIYPCFAPMTPRMDLSAGDAAELRGTIEGL